jgi:hypothetical protein
LHACQKDPIVRPYPALHPTGPAELATRGIEAADADSALSVTDGATEALPLPAAAAETEVDAADAGTEPAEDRVRPDYASRWILQRIIELGWTPERFGDFDREVNRYDTHRSEDKPERMSKKYQWIALREFMARLLDQRSYRHRNQQTERYEGVRQLRLGDLDPSLLARGRPDARSAVRPSTLPRGLNVLPPRAGPHPGHRRCRREEQLEGARYGIRRRRLARQVDLPATAAG